jgi:hypothetical protein
MPEDRDEWADEGVQNCGTFKRDHVLIIADEAGAIDVSGLDTSSYTHAGEQLRQHCRRIGLPDEVPKDLDRNVRIGIDPARAGGDRGFIAFYSFGFGSVEYVSVSFERDARVWYDHLIGKHAHLRATPDGCGCWQRWTFSRGDL